MSCEIKLFTSVVNVNAWLSKLGVSDRLTPELVSTLSEYHRIGQHGDPWDLHMRACAEEVVEAMRKSGSQRIKLTTFGVTPEDLLKRKYYHDDREAQRLESAFAERLARLNIEFLTRFGAAWILRKGEIQAVIDERKEALGALNDKARQIVNRNEVLYPHLGVIRDDQLTQGFTMTNPEALKTPPATIMLEGVVLNFETNDGTGETREIFLKPGGDIHVETERPEEAPGECHKRATAIATRIAAVIGSTSQFTGLPVSMMAQNPVPLSDGVTEGKRAQEMVLRMAPVVRQNTSPAKR